MKVETQRPLTVIASLLSLDRVAYKYASMRVQLYACVYIYAYMYGLIEVCARLFCVCMRTSSNMAMLTYMLFTLHYFQ